MSDFVPTLAWVREIYRTFNKKYFNEELPALTVFNFYISQDTDFYGRTKIYFYQNEYNELEPILDKTEITISKSFSLSEIEYEDILLHEMIHVYQGTILYVWPDHGETFKEKMNEFNKTYNRKIVEYKDIDKTSLQEESLEKKKVPYPEAEIFLDEWIDGEHIVGIEIV